ncbi:MAG: hypothetical protein R2716_09625 [Microthrixaceae bacterium]
MNRARGLPAAALLLILALLAACGRTASDSAASSTSEPSDANPQGRSWLYAMQAEGPSSYDSGTGRLSMPTELIQAFTDRPYRDARLTSPDSFAALWTSVGADSFSEDPPNAVLTYWDDEERTGYPTTVVCELTGEVVYDPDTKQLSMGMEMLEPKDAELPATLHEASLFVDDGPDCYNSDTDENIIEYFNLINYMGDFMIKITSRSADSYDLSILCPEKQSSDMPPAEFELALRTATGGESTSCYSDTPMTLSKTNPDCDSNGQCDFVVELSNRSTGKIYSQTEVKQVLKADLMTNPELNPASLPICLGAAEPQAAGS